MGLIHRVIRHEIQIQIKQRETYSKIERWHKLPSAHRNILALTVPTIYHPNLVNMPSNRAAWQNEVGEKLDVRSAPYTSPKEGEIVVKAHAWAINPADWALQSSKLFDWLKYPLILGCDIAGEVAEVGSDVTRFKEGDRVLAMTIGQIENNPSGGGFQDYVVVHSILASPIPDSLSYAEASVFPLCVSTAAWGLFQEDFLGLQYPSIPPKPTGKTIVVWGGSSAVGSNAIQLAVAGGYEVFATGSTKNTEYLKKLGASKVFDYKSESVIADIVAAVDVTQFSGIFHAAGAVEPCLEVAARAKGNSFVAAALPLPEAIPSSVEAKMIWGSTLKDNKAGAAIFIDFLPQALAQGSYLVAPEPLIIGKGLESIQDGFEIQKKGVSAKKVVIIQ